MSGNSCCCGSIDVMTIDGLWLQDQNTTCVLEKCRIFCAILHRNIYVTSVFGSKLGSLIHWVQGVFHLLPMESFGSLLGQIHGFDGRAGCLDGVNWILERNAAGVVWTGCAPLE